MTIHHRLPLPVRRRKSPERILSVVISSYWTLFHSFLQFFLTTPFPPPSASLSLSSTIFNFLLHSSSRFFFFSFSLLLFFLFLSFRQIAIAIAIAKKNSANAAKHRLSFLLQNNKKKNSKISVLLSQSLRSRTPGNIETSSSPSPQPPGERGERSVGIGVKLEGGNLS